MRLRYHLRKALQWRPWRTEAPSFGLGNQLPSACRHFLKAYLWIMFPLVLGVFFGGYALLWDDSNIHGDDPDTWSSPWKLIKEVRDLKNPSLIEALLRAYLPILLVGVASWISLLYIPILISWYAFNLRSDCEPNYSRWVPGLTALHGWLMVLRPDRTENIIPWFILISYTATAVLITAYLCWWRPRRLLREIDTERDLMREDDTKKIPPKENSDSEE